MSIANSNLDESSSGLFNVISCLLIVSDYCTKTICVCVCGLCDDDNNNETVKDDNKDNNIYYNGWIENKSKTFTFLFIFIMLFRVLSGLMNV